MYIFRLVLFITFVYSPLSPARESGISPKSMVLLLQLGIENLGVHLILKMQ